MLFAELFHLAACIGTSFRFKVFILFYGLGNIALYGQTIWLIHSPADGPPRGS